MAIPRQSQWNYKGSEGYVTGVFLAPQGMVENGVTLQAYRYERKRASAKKGADTDGEPAVGLWYAAVP